MEVTTKDTIDTKGTRERFMHKTHNLHNGKRRILAARRYQA